jgi:oligopeptide transport system permease protein
MLFYAAKRILGAVPTLFVIVALSFFLIRLAPGGPFDKERRLPPEIEENLRRVYHLDEPLWRQFGGYLGGLAQGDLGPSFQYKDYSVTELIGGGFPVSLRIGALAMVLALGIGVALGTVAALRHNRWPDHLVMAGAMIGIAVPVFVMAPLLVLVLAVRLGWLPAGGWTPGNWREFVLPVVALSLPQIAFIARLTRGGMVEVLRLPFVTVARSKGLSESRVTFGHALKVAILPVVSYLGPATAGLITGSVVIEQVFGIPGVGRYFVQGALNRDYTLVLGVVILYGALIIAANLAVDLVYGWLDPRVRY